jgi:hypothetical protein
MQSEVSLPIPIAILLPTLQAGESKASTTSGSTSILMNVLCSGVRKSLANLVVFLQLSASSAISFRLTINCRFDQPKIFRQIVDFQPKILDFRLDCSFVSDLLSSESGKSDFRDLRTFKVEGTKTKKKGDCGCGYFMVGFGPYSENSDWDWG